ncbi:MAG: TlpA disulfide reductase family protein [Ignavibacteriota bacterium]
MLIFWATWNNGSHPEMLMLGQVYQRIHVPESDFDILGIAVDDELAAVKQFAADSNLTYPLALDHHREIADAYQIRSVPTALIVDTSGKITYGSVGFARDRQFALASQLGFSPSQFQMNMGAPRGRGN